MPNADIRIIARDGIQYVYDQSRGKLLSIPKLYLRAGTRKRTVTNEFLHLEGDTPSMGVGDPMLRKATIIGLNAQCERPHSWSVKIFKKGDSTPLVILPIVSDTMAQNLSLSEDIDSANVLLYKVEGTNIPFPRIMLELAWRL